MIWKVRGYLYGLRDGAANLRKKAISHLVRIGGKVSETDPCLMFFWWKEGILGAATIWVDDYFVVGGRKLVEFVKEKIQEEFTVGENCQRFI